MHSSVLRLTIKFRPLIYHSMVWVLIIHIYMCVCKQCVNILMDLYTIVLIYYNKIKYTKIYIHTYTHLVIILKTLVSLTVRWITCCLTKQTMFVYVRLLSECMTDRPPATSGLLISSQWISCTHSLNLLEIWMDWYGWLATPRRVFVKVVRLCELNLSGNFN